MPGASEERASPTIATSCLAAQAKPRTEMVVALDLVGPVLLDNLGEARQRHTPDNRLQD